MVESSRVESSRGQLRCNRRVLSYVRRGQLSCNGRV